MIYANVVKIVVSTIRAYRNIILSKDYTIFVGVKTDLKYEKEFIGIDCVNGDGSAILQEQ